MNTTSSSPSVAAIFDMDHTLLSGSTGSMLVRYLRRTNRLYDYLRRRDIPRFMAVVLMYRFGVLDPTRPILAMGRSMAGVDADALWLLARQWFAEVVVPSIRGKALQRLNWHRRQGHVPVICSGSSQFAVDLLAEHLQIDDAISTEWMIEDGQLTGELRQPLVYGPGKVFWMEKWSAQNRIDLSRSYFYTDHISDQPLLERVAHPVAVNPDRRLRRLARQRSWELADWE